MPLGPDPYLVSIQDELVALRHELHQIPEVGLDLPQTQQRVLKALEGLPLEITLGKKLSSITAVLRGKAPSNGPRRTVLLRGDMDALPVVEQTGLAWASTNGAMHACGHDCHMTGLVGAARALSHKVDELPGDVVFMFQPGEESDRGAELMIAEGVLDAAGKRVDAAYGLHVWSGLDKAGIFYCRPGTIMASSDMADFEFVGKGGHGSAPHLAVDPVPAMAEVITALQVMIARHFNIWDPVVITCGHVEAGVARNIIPETATIEATMRAFSKQAQQQLFDMVPHVVTDVAASHGVTANVKLTNLYPATINHDEGAALVAKTATDLFGADHFVEMANPMGAAEDFSLVLEQVPGAFAILPATPPDKDPAQVHGNHSPFALYDDSVLLDAAALLSELATRTLADAN
ncbi:Peptidase M20D, amidohydrolase [Propionibacterium freudenreichii]|uniref:M20 metallopeptidase family protein n=1 Tax=Propionibacterium freudenreichii TaxID=1744 RepID=UPI0005440B62|nr:M20 family metallopeptidase [Propionibacterium freudenreichii]CEH02570.1 Amidohydrolase (Peptidase M20D) (Putative metal-dependent amidase/aminoacylase/carboxypeptidase) [Propionibacterium freudenreichii]SCQ65505.1 Peptidase M20D, amidohydrolase [Propionibacterium freudenreichii]SCQ75205.1 Peptidase M20D, amidohydrolase [Propionibacterium freudenreichii]